jgi:hypothetical protein
MRVSSDLAEQAGNEVPLLQDASWFVYLLPLTDCSAFKVGFSCNPWQRIYSFSHRYFECFDLHRALLLRLEECEQARAIEALLKAELAANRCPAPQWLPTAAGGHTEWFSAVHFMEAQTLLEATQPAQGGAQMLVAFDLIHAELTRRRTEFESWAWHLAQQLCAARRPQPAGHDRLRDWFDAYRCFGIPVFDDDPEVRRFVLSVRNR